MKSHVFITAKYLEKCLETGLFGVSAPQLNYLANVDVGDSIFLLETGSGRLVGPLQIIQCLFYNNDFIWGDRDPFAYRVEFASFDGVWEADIISLWSVLLKRERYNFYTFTTFQRSNNTLLPNEGEKLTQELKKNGKPISPIPRSRPNVEHKSVDLIKSDIKKFSSEARLETALLRRKDKFTDILIKEGLLNKNVDPFIINQITIPGTNYNVDIAIFSGDQVIIVELKKDQINDSTVQQIRKYSQYWKLVGKDVILIVIGTEITSSANNIIFFDYRIDPAKKILQIKRGEGERYYIPL